MNGNSKLIPIFIGWLLLVSSAFAAAPESDAMLGKKIFERATCAVCHPAGANTLHPGKPLKGPDFAGKYKDDEAIAKVVRSGVPNSGMPAFNKSQMSDRELKLVIVYIRSLTPTTPSKNTGHPQ
jgi:mono/diheme cytochrome c family protein